jgi:hypothetical protein
MNEINSLINEWRAREREREREREKGERVLLCSQPSILLPQSLESWDYRHAPPLLAQPINFN